MHNVCMHNVCMQSDESLKKRKTHLWKVFGQPHVGQFKCQKWSKY